ncbi:ragulator complex protein LAMTOR1-like [Saccostrea echinata]|uniref:ragulator complex protein LAMTOR1-like n=1 Tax=Saccostrea echinata TaxID=191078 RepID=UPI002A82963D|nr:ragulator complex protein LAMTOR1-like [Saccostrea echinata]XP_061188107.1 ragulator complex protein LAMTOR1-like [Saccostrea echinata]
MGCCFSDSSDKDGDDPYSGGPNERDRLLPEPTSGGQSGPSYNTPSQRNVQKVDEPSALEKILHRTVRKIIDVSPGDTVEQQEYNDRAFQYSNRVNMVLGGSSKIRASRPPLPNSMTAPHNVLSSAPVSLADIQLITQATEKAAQALGKVRVHHKEDLVVPFGVP